MAWWRRTKIDWQMGDKERAVVAADPGARLHMSDLEHRTFRLDRRGLCWGRTIEQRSVRGCKLVESTYLPMPLRSVHMTAIDRPLPVLRVGNDFFADPQALPSGPVAAVPLPKDEDPYDGRSWRVHCADADFARALLDEAFWTALERWGRSHKLDLAVDGRWALSIPTDDLGEVLVGFAEQVERRLASGDLDRWVREPDFCPQPDFDRFAGTDWRRVDSDRSILFWLWQLWPYTDYSLWLRGTVDGHDFRALRIGYPDMYSKDPELAYYYPLESAGLVMLPLRHDVPDHVHYAHKPRFDRGNVTTEWLDFNDDFEVRASDERVGLEVTTPRLMGYLYDNRVHRMDVKGPWLLARVKKFDVEHITKMVRVLAGARELLPSYKVKHHR